MIAVAKTNNFEGDNTGDMFGTWLIKKQRTGSTVVAHNARGYDACFFISLSHLKQHCSQTDTEWI